MAIRIYILIILITASAQTLTGCPTCIGRLQLQSPAFFSDELYQLDPEDDVPSTLIQANGLGELPRTSDVQGLKPTKKTEMQNASEDDEDD